MSEVVGSMVEFLPFLLTTVGGTVKYITVALTLTFKKSRTFSRVFGERGLVTFGLDKSKGL